MYMDRRNIWNTRVFVGLLLLAGVLHIVENTFHNISQPDYSVVTIFFCLVFMIYTVLIIFWIQSLYARLLPSKARSYMVVIGLLMVFYLVLRVFKYRIAGDNTGLRLTWYAFYIPMTFIPALFLAVSIRIAKGNRPSKLDERLLLIPAGILSGIILTNDLHHLVFVPNPGVTGFIGTSGTYTYRITFYLTYAWMIITIVIGIVLLLRACGVRKNRRKLLFVAGIVAIWFILIRLHTIKKYIEFIPPYESPEIHIFCMLAIFEFCIRQRLIPYNENYTGFFAKLPMPVVITDRKFDRIYRSANVIEADREEFGQALESPVYPQPDMKLSGRQIQGGYAFWLEDESEVRKANERLMEANSTLESENTLIEYENKQKEKNAYLRSRHHIYHEIAEKMYPYQKRIERLLDEAKPGTEGFKESIAYVSVLNAYVKRKTNLLLMASEEGGITLHELMLAVSESGRYLSYVGIKTSVDESGFTDGEERTASVTAENIIALYDTFETLAERMIGHASLLMISYDGNALKLAADTEQAVVAGDTELPVRIEDNDGILFMIISAKKGGE